MTSLPGKQHLRAHARARIHARARRRLGTPAAAGPATMPGRRWWPSRLPVAVHAPPGTPNQAHPSPHCVHAAVGPLVEGVEAGADGGAEHDRLLQDDRHACGTDCSTQGALSRALGYRLRPRHVLTAAGLDRCRQAAPRPACMCACMAFVSAGRAVTPTTTPQYCMLTGAGAAQAAGGRHRRHQ